MSPKRSLAVPPVLGAAIARLPDGDPARRRTRAVARLLEAGLRPREIVELDCGEPGSASACLSWPNPSSVWVAGRKARIVQLGGAAAADLAAFHENRRAGYGAVSLSQIDDAVAAVAAKAGTKLRAHDFRTIAAIRIVEAPTDEDRRRTRRDLEGPDGEGSP